jgi:hypothetical protein
MTIHGTTTPGQSGIEHVLGMLRLLYPEPWSVGEASGSDAGQRRTFVLLPTAKNPRLVLPATPGRVLAGAIDQQLAGRRTRTRFAGQVLRTLARTGAAAAWPARVAIHGRADAGSLEEWLGRTLGVDNCRIAISVGRPRANRKPVVQVLDDTGAVRAFVKVGVNELTTTLIDNEAAALRAIAEAALAGVRVPGVISHDRWQGLPVLVLEPVPTSGGGGSRRRTLMRSAVNQISAIGRTDLTRWTPSGFRARLIQAIADAGPRVAGLHDVVGRLDADDPAIAFGAWHGDFNPGNFAVHRDTLVVWDWERFDRGVPLGFDLLHHDLHDAITRQARDPYRAAVTLVDEAESLLAGLAAGPEPARASAELYLAWLACRYVRDRQDRAGARLGVVEDWLLPALGCAGGR